MEHLQKIETKLIRKQNGQKLRLDYCLLRETENGPYGLEVILEDSLGSCRASFPRLSESCREVTALIHSLAFRCVLPRAMRRRLAGGEKTGQTENMMV